MLDGRLLVRILSSQDGRCTVAVCPAVKTLAARFSKNRVLASMLAPPRLDRVYFRNHGEVVVTSASVPCLVLTCVAAQLSADVHFVATPPYIPPLITMYATDRIHVHERALIDSNGGTKAVPTTPMNVVIENIRKIALQTGSIPKQAQISLRFATIQHALSLGYDSHAQFITVRIPNFGLKKLFSLDIGHVLSIADSSNNMIGYTFERHIEGEKEAETVTDTLGCRGICIHKPSKQHGQGGYTKYMTFAEHPRHENEFLYNMATEEALLMTGVRWWDTALEQFGGVPLDDTNHKDQVFACIDDEWHPIDAEPVVNGAMVAQRFPHYQDKKYR